jgi:hypothetical protein
MAIPVTTRDSGCFLNHKITFVATAKSPLATAYENKRSPGKGLGNSWRSIRLKRKSPPEAEPHGGLSLNFSQLFVVGQEPQAGRGNAKPRADIDTGWRSSP